MTARRQAQAEPVPLVRDVLRAGARRSAEVMVSDHVHLLGALRLPTVSEELHDRLVAAIALGHFAPGERLPPERHLAEQLGVARTTVRAAVGRLRQEGLVKVQVGRSGGTFVASNWVESSAANLRTMLGEQWPAWEELFEMRALTESLVARTAAEHRGGPDRAELESILEEFRTAVTPEAIRASDARLHTAIAAATGNSYLVALSTALRQQVNLGFSFDPYRPHSHLEAVRHHARLVDAVLAGRAESAARIGRRHFLITEDAVREVRARTLLAGSSEAVRVSRDLRR